MKSYRTAFLITLALTLFLAAALGYVWQRSRPERPLAQAPPAPAAARAPVPLAPVQLTPQRAQSIGVKFGVVEIKPVHDEIRTTGDVEVDETRVADVQVRFPGWIQKVFADSVYQRVRQGQALFTVYSPELVATEQEYLLARQGTKMLAQSTVPGVPAESASLLSASTERLKQWGMPDQAIRELEATGRVRRDIEIDSPVSGYITERNALPNMYVQPGTRLYTVADLSTVWVYAQVFQNQIGLLKRGDPATVTVDAYPGRNFAGRVDFIWPQVDQATRTARVRLVFPNPELKLALGMFVNLRLEIPLGRHMVIPAAGVFQSGTRQIAFVDRGDGYLQPREVELGARTGDEFIVLKGLQAGERIATSANFLIDSESQLQAAMGSFAPPPGAGAASATNQPAEQGTIELRTDPSPPHKGSNTVRVRLTGAGGQPVTGAQVTVTFFMPAMPAMGMAAVRTVATLSDRGGGFYEGRGKLESGGVWQVTITASRGGQTIAQKQLTVAATGGM